MHDFLPLRAALDDGTRLRIQRWEAKVGEGCGEGCREGVQPHCLSKLLLSGARSPAQKIWPGPSGARRGVFGVFTHLTKGFPQRSGLFFSGWARRGQRSVEALPLARPQGGGYPASPRDPEMAGRRTGTSWSSQTQLLPLTCHKEALRRFCEEL